MIQASSLRKEFGSTVSVNDISFSLPTGGVVGLLGPNGAGKTTTMRLLTTYLPPSAGSATVAGYDIIKEPEKVRASIGYLPETPPLYPEMTVQEYLHFVGKLRGLRGKKLKASLSTAVDKCFIGEVQSKLCSEISKGYKQRVGLAQAIIHSPPVIILDEPTSGLDPAQIIKIRELIRSLGEDHTVILSTHILPEVIETCSHVLIIAKGSLVQDTPLMELTAKESLEKRFLELVSK